jgi:nucleoside-diphosphate-sugar epimerase
VKYECIEKLLKNKEKLKFTKIINASGHYSNKPTLNEFKANSYSNALLPLQIIELISSETKLVVNLNSYLEFAPLPAGSTWSQYAASKILGRKTLEEYCISQNINFVSCILYDNYSEDLSRAKFLDQLIYAVRDRKSLSVSNTNHKMDLIYINDLIESIIEISEFDYTNNVNSYQIRSGQVYSIKELISTIGKLTGTVPRIEFDHQISNKLVVSKIWDSAPNWQIKKSTLSIEDYLIKMLL